MATWLDLISEPLIVYDYNIGTIDHMSYLVENNIIHSIKIYNRALTKEEIFQNHQAGYEWIPQIGKHTVTIITRPIIMNLSRKGTGKREAISTVKPITGKVTKRLPPIHANINLKERTPNITTRERIPKLEVD